MKASTVLAGIDLDTLNAIRLRADDRLDDHIEDCETCKAGSDLSSLCAQGRVLYVNRNRAESLYVRGIEARVIAEGLAS